MDYLQRCDDAGNTRIRFDSLCVCIFSSDRALIRHHISCLS